MLRDKKTGNKRGAAFIKFEMQSEAARAKEDCDPSEYFQTVLPVCCTLYILL